MAYRNDVEALEARLAALDGEVAEQTRARDEAAALLAEARARAEMSGLAADWAAGGPMQRRRRRFRIAAGVALCSALCVALTAGIIRHHGTPNRGDQMLLQFAMFTGEMCACRDKTCVETTSNNMTQWSMQLANESQPPKIDDGTMKVAIQLGERMARCMSTATGTP